MVVTGQFNQQPICHRFTVSALSHLSPKHRRNENLSVLFYEEKLQVMSYILYSYIFASDYASILSYLSLKDSCNLKLKCYGAWLSVNHRSEYILHLREDSWKVLLVCQDSRVNWSAEMNRFMLQLNESYYICSAFLAFPFSSGQAESESVPLGLRGQNLVKQRSKAQQIETICTHLTVRPLISFPFTLIFFRRVDEAG